MTHEQVTWFTDPAVGLRAVVAIHSTALGPALGGIRFWHYDSERDALADALRLSRAMTMKAAAAGLRQGGGKTVVMWDQPSRTRSGIFLRSLGRCIDALGGRYLAAEDVGASQHDMDGIARETPWVTGIDPAYGGSGDPSPVTAFGVLHGMRAACDAATMAGRSVVIQGAGHVGAHLARLLVDDGARVRISDIDGGKAAAAGVPVLDADDVVTADCDVLAPCALGGVLSEESVAELRCAVVCGAANNQLKDERAAAALSARGIVYAPDYVVNAGGIINIAQEWAPGGYSSDRAYAEAARIEDTTRHVLTLARECGITTSRAADDFASRRIEREGGAPYRPGAPSEMRDTLLRRSVLLCSSRPSPSP